MAAAGAVRVMKALVVAACLAALTLFPASAVAQQSGAVIVFLQAPEEVVTDGQSIVIAGVVTLTVDITAFTEITGIPVEYAVTGAPAWASVVVSPANDVFPIGYGAPTGVAYTVTRQIMVTLTAAESMPEDLTDVIEITATTSPGLLGRSFTGKGSTIVAYDAPEEPCPEHAGMTHEQMAAMAVDAANAYNAQQREEQTGTSDDVTVQNASASPVPMPWVAVGGFALVGAGVGLVLRRKYA